MLIDAGRRPGPLDEPGEKPVGEGVVGAVVRGGAGGGEKWWKSEQERERYGRWAGGNKGNEGRVLIK